MEMAPTASTTATTPTIGTSHAVETADPMAAAARCRNCDAVLLGRYCVNCSQAADVHVPSTTELIHEALEGLTHSDSRLWRTLLWLWFRPGKLTQEFIAGRRVAYMPPFRLYLVLSIIFFLTASVTHMQGQMVRFDDQASPGTPAVSNCSDLNVTITGYPNLTQRIQHACTEVVRDNGANLMQLAFAAMPKAMFIFLPLVAFLHMLMYWHPRHRYAEHLLFFLHLHAFFFSAAILLILAIHAAGTWPSWAKPLDLFRTLLGWSMVLYAFVAVRRVFGGGWVRNFFKAIVLAIVYLTVLSFGVAGVFLYALWEL
jgi:hypothetical protein